jgi:hypothetical protein
MPTDLPLGRTLASQNRTESHAKCGAHTGAQFCQHGSLKNIRRVSRNCSPRKISRAAAAGHPPCATLAGRGRGFRRRMRPIDLHCFSCSGCILCVVSHEAGLTTSPVTFSRRTQGTRRRRRMRKICEQRLVCKPWRRPGRVWLQVLTSCEGRGGEGGGRGVRLLEIMCSSPVRGPGGKMEGRGGQQQLNRLD